MKAECTGKLDMDTSTLERLGLSYLPTAQLHMLNMMLLAKPVAPAEAYCIVKGQPIVRFKTDVVHVNSSPPGQRSFCKHGSSFSVHPVQVYMQRPTELEHLSFKAFCRSHLVLSAKASVPEDAEYICNIGAKRVFSMENIIVRFTNFHPVHHTEGFCYNLLLDQVPFRYDEELLSCQGNQATPSYYNECLAREIFQDEEGLQATISSYTEYNLWEQDTIVILANQVLQTHTLELPLCLDSDDIDGDTAMVRRISAQVVSLLSEFAFTRDCQPTSSQAAAVHSICANPVGLHAIHGGPGTGKTFILKYLTDKLREKGLHVDLCASTGAAASRMSPHARTAHSYFAIPAKGFVKPLSPASDTYHRLRHCNVIIIDECSMITFQLLHQCLTTISNVRGIPITEVLATMCIISVGDMKQLPCVCVHNKGTAQSDEPLDICRICHLGCSPYWALANKHKLTVSVRHAQDPSLANFIGIIADRPPTQQEINDTFASSDFNCMIQADDVMREVTPETTILCTQEKHAHDFNARIMQATYGSSPTCACIDMCACHTLRSTKIGHNIPASTLNRNDVLQAWLADENGKFNLLPKVAVGCKVMLTDNLDQSKGIVNGASATVIGVSMAPVSPACPDGIDRICIRMHATGLVHVVGRSFTRRTYTPGYTFWKSTFPLMFAYALTAHKAQGCTLTDKTIVHCQEAFAPGHLYVLLSRSTHRRNLRIIGPLTPALFVPITF